MKIYLTILLAFLVSPTNLFANPNWEDNIPNNLKPWIKWVSRDLKVNKCLFSYNNFDDKECAWEGKLSLNLNNKNGNFTYQVVLDDEGTIPLPGNADYWPQTVKVDSALQPVTEQGNVPTVYLPAGSHIITGEYSWKILPDKFLIPSTVALLDIKLNGEPLPFPNFQSGYLTLHQPKTEVVSTEVNFLDLKVFRRIEDNLPTKIDTLVKLEISGKAREITLNQISIPGFALSNIESILPVNIDQQGNILVQARAGSYEIKAISFSNSALQEIKFPTGENWVPYEIWSFASTPSLRVVDITGANAIDPTLYNIPNSWQNLNTYKVSAGESLQIVERKRGEAKQTNNSLVLNRIIKLNFDGASFSIKDQIDGQIASDQHLKINPDYNLGNVTINGIDQLITQTSTSKNLVGIEVRPGQINLMANSQTNNIKELRFPGWQTELNSANNTIYLAPGWQLFHIWGADFVHGSWFSKWTLLDIFLVMLTVVAILKVYNWQTALLALIALLLFEKTLFSISGIILFGTALVAITKYISHQKFVTFCNRLKVLTMSITALFVLNYIFTDLKLAIHPQLKPISFNDQNISSSYDDEIYGTNEPLMKGKSSYESSGIISRSKKIGSALSLMEDKAEGGFVAPSSPQFYQTNIDQAVQTGRGVSNWQTYQSYSFGWNTPIIQDQNIKFSLISPTMNIFLSFLRAILILLLLSRFFITSLPFKIPLLKTLSILSLILFSQASVDAQEQQREETFPSQQILEELSSYVQTNQQEPPKCLPNCANISKLRIDLKDQKFSLIFEIHSLEDLFFTLPFNRADFAIEKISINDSTDDLRVKTNGSALLIALKKGINLVDLSGIIQDRETINLSFPKIPSSGEFQVSGWTLTGISQNGKVDPVISLSRIQKEAIPTSTNKEVTPSFKPLKLAQQFTISRHINLAYDVTITTTIQRLTPASSGYELTYQLLKDESLITPGVEVKNNQLVAEFKPGEYQKVFNSILKVTDKLELIASDNKIWNEKWHLTASNLWHFDYSGTPRIYFNEQTPEWHPRPGENLTLTLEKPVGVVGTTKTIESLSLSSNLGKDLQTFNLNFQIKSSKGEIHPVELPQNIEITGVKINQLAQSFKTDSSKIDLNLVPGSQNIEIDWREKKDLTKYYKLSDINLGAPIANLNINYQIPERRWVIATGGTKYGPAVLFWGYFPLVLILAWGLSYFKSLPLKFYQWILLLIGLSQVSFGLNCTVILWFVFLGIREKSKIPNYSFKFPLLQIFLAIWTYWAFEALYSTIQTGLLGSPRMMIAGNQSSSFILNWYQDLSTGSLPNPWFFSLDIWYYRILMLLWALWLASSIIKWVKWAFVAYTTNGAWYQKRTKDSHSIDNKPE